MKAAEAMKPPNEAAAAMTPPQAHRLMLASLTRWCSDCVAARMARDASSEYTVR